MSLGTETRKQKADALPMSNGLTEIPISESSSVMNRMLRGAMNPAPEVCKLFDPGGQGLAYEVSLACGRTVLHFTATNEDISAAKTRSCVRDATGQQRRGFDPGGPP